MNKLNGQLPVTEMRLIRVWNDQIKTRLWMLSLASASLLGRWAERGRERKRGKGGLLQESIRNALLSHWPSENRLLLMLPVGRQDAQNTYFSFSFSLSLSLTLTLDQTTCEWNFLACFFITTFLFHSLSVFSLKIIFKDSLPRFIFHNGLSVNWSIPTGSLSLSPSLVPSLSSSFFFLTSSYRTPKYFP